MDNQVQQSYDLKNTKEVLALGFKLGALIKEAKENDGKIDINDAGLFFQVIPMFAPAIQDIAHIPNELKDLSTAEAEELAAYISTQVGVIVDQEKIVDQINKGLKMLHSIYVFVKTF